MKRRFHSAFRHHPVIATELAVAVAIAFVVLSGQALGWARWQLFALRIDGASTQSDAAPARVASWSFAFRDRAVTLRVPISVNELDAARNVDTSAMFAASGSLRAHYVSHVVRVQSRSAFIGSLADELRRVRRERGLDDDEYLELITRSVQSLRYDTVGRRVSLPVEVVASGSGVCSEKALLLAAIMLHEGYETGMWVFDSQSHVALAVGSDGAQFRDSGYSFIETTRIAYVGEYDVAFRAAGPLCRPPQFIALGGTRRYHAGREVEFILQELAVAQKRAGSPRYLPFVTQATLRQWPERFTVLAAKEEAARRLASYIRGQTDNRKAVFEWLVRAATEAAQSRPAFLH